MRSSSSTGPEPRSTRHRRVEHRSWRGWLLVPPDVRIQSAAFVVLLVLLVGTVFALTQSGGHDNVATPPTPPSPSATPPGPAGSFQTSAANHVKPAHAIACGHPRASTFGGDAPQQLCVPSIGVDTSVMSLGLNADRTVQVPPLSQVRVAGWYKYSAAPGDDGPTVILGHVDSAVYGDGVFYHLGTLTSGDKVLLTRADGAVATYRITRVDEVSKTHFPTASVYGTTPSPTIRLVTCGGRFDSGSGNYLDNIIAYGTIVSLHRPTA